LLQRVGLGVGSVVALTTDPHAATARAFRIVGAYEPVADPLRFSAPRLEVRLHLADLQDLTADPRDPLARETVSTLNVALRDPGDAEAFARDVSARMPTLVAVSTTAGAGAVTFEVLRRFHFAISLVTVLGSTAFLLALMVMRADERREVAGILRLLGFSRRRVLLQVLLEGLLVAGLGALFGAGLAGALQGVVNRFFQWRYDTALVFVRVTPEIALHALLLAVPLGVLAGLVASWTLLRRSPLELLHR